MESNLAATITAIGEDIKDLRDAQLGGRTTLTINAGTLASNATAQGAIAVPAGLCLRKITTSVSCRVRLYPSASARNIDLSRQLGVDYIQGSALFLEFYSTAALLSAVLSPAIACYSDDDSLYYSIQNLSPSSATVTVSFDHLPQEL